MAIYTDQLKNAIENKKNALVNFKGEELVQKTAEVVMLKHLFTELPRTKIKRSNFTQAEIWDDPQLRKYYNEFMQGPYSKTRRQLLTTITANVRGIMNRLGSADPDTPLPEALYEYAVRPETLTDEKLAEIREQLYAQGYKFDNFIVHPGPMPEGQKKAIAEEIKMIPNTVDENRDKIITYFSEAEIRFRLEYFAKRAGFTHDRNATMANLFRVYLIGEKGMNYETAAAMVPGTEGFEGHFNDYMQFLMTHPVVPLAEGVVANEEHIPVTPEQMKTNARALADMFKKCGDYFKTYTIPDIDFTKPDEVKNVYGQIGGLKDFITDLGQESQKLLSQPVFTELPESRRQVEEAMQPAYQIAPFGKMLESGYGFEDNATLKTNPANYAKSVAANRVLFAETANRKYRGKTGEDLVRERKANAFYDEDLGQTLTGLSLTYGDISDEEVLTYLKTGDGTLKPKMQAHIEDVRNDLKNSFNRENTANALILANEKLTKPVRKSLKTYFKKIFGDGTYNSQEISENIQEKGQDKLQKAQNETSAFLDKLFVENGRADLLKMAGVNDPLPLIKVDGKTPGELWGEKYNTLQPAEKENMLRLEVMNALVRGDSRITVDTFAVNENDELVPADSYAIIDSRNNIERTKNFLRDVDDLHLMATAAMGELDRPGFSVSDKNRALFVNMRNTLNRLVRETDINGNASLTSMNTAFENYRTAAEAFYNAEINALGGNKEAIALVRKHRFNTLTAFSEKHDEIINDTKGLSTKLVNGPFDEENHCSFKNVKSEMVRLAKARGLDENEMLIKGEGEGKNEIGLEWVDEYDDIDATLENPEFEALNQRKHVMPKVSDSLKQSLKSNLTGIYENGYADITGKDNFQDFLTQVGVAGRFTVESLFLHYLMGEKGYSFEQAVEMTHAHDKNAQGNYVSEEAHRTAANLEKDFVTFLKRNPLKPAPNTINEETAKASVEAWLKLFSSSREKIEAYKIPDIDFSDISQVEKHYEELYLLSSVAVDGHQSLDGMLKNDEFKKYFSTTRIGAEYFKDETRFWELRQFYDSLQNVMCASFRSGYLELPNVEHNSVLSLAIQGLYREAAGKYMSTFSGKTIGECFANEPDKVALATAVGTGWYNVPAGNFTSDGVRMEQWTANPKTVLDYSLNRNPAAFKNYQKRMENAVYKDCMKREFPQSDLTAQINLRGTIIGNPVMKQLSSVGESPASIKEFLDKKVSGNLTGKDFVENVFTDMFSKIYRGHMYRNGFRESDMVLIDGKPIMELVAHKYMNYTSFDEKELFYRLEILKCIAAGKQTISFRTLDYADDKTIKPGKEAVIFLPAEKMAEMRNSYIEYRMEKENLISELEEMKKVLMTTQEEGDTFGRDGGSGLYVAYAKALDECLTVLKGEKYDAPAGEYNRIRGKLVNLEKAASDYYEARKDTDNKKSLIRMGQSKKVKGGLVSKFDSLRKGFATNLMADSESTFAEKNDYRLNGSINDLSVAIGKGEINYENERDAYLRNKIASKLEEIKNSPEYKEIMARVPADNAKRAVQYLTGYYDNLSKPALPGEEKRHLSMDDLRRTEHFMEEYKVYEKNVLFQRYMTEDPDKTIRNWAAVEEGQRQLKNHYQVVLNNYVNDAGSLQRYVASVDEAANQQRDFRDVAMEIKNLPESEAKNARRLALIGNLASAVVYQILTSDTEEAKMIREGINQNVENFQNLKDAVINVLSESRVIESSKKITQTVEALESGKLRDDCMKRLTEDFAAKEKTRETEKESKKGWDRTLAEGSYLFLDMPHHKLTDKDYKQIADNAGITEENQRILELNKTGMYFTGQYPIEYTGEDGQKITMQANLNRISLAGFNASRLHTVQSMFTLWLMAEHDIGLEEAIKISQTMPVKNKQNQVVNGEDVNRANKYRAQFVQFLYENPINVRTETTSATGQKFFETKQVPKEQAEQTYGKWADIFIKGTKKIKEYRIPDIDYRNKDEVLDHFDELCAFTGMLVNESQEFGNIFKNSEGVQGLRVFKEKIGGEQKLADFHRFWLSLQSPIQTLVKSHTSRMDLIPNYEKNLLWNYGTNRYLCGKYMSQIKGMTLEQAAEYSFRKGWTAHLDNVSILLKNKALTNEVVGKSFKDAVLYDSGIRSEAYEKEVEEFEEAEKARREVGHDIKVAYSRFIANLKINDALKEKLCSISDGDVDKMKEFLNTEGPYEDNGRNRLGKDWISDKFSIFASDPNIYIAAESLGLKAGDLITVDGKTPEQLWGDKYAHIESQAEKDALLQLEVMRQIALGKANIEFRGFDWKNGKYVDLGPLTVIPSRDYTLDNVLDDVHSYPIELEQMLSELRGYRTRLIATQTDKRANFYKNTNGVIERVGKTEEYKNFTASLRVLIDLLEREKKGEIVEKKEILDAFDKLSEDAKKYDDSHSGLFSAFWSGDGRRRRALSREMTTSVREMKKYFLHSRKGFENNYISIKGFAFKEATYADIKNTVASLENRYEIKVGDDAYYQKNHKLNQFRYNLGKLFQKEIRAPRGEEKEYTRAYEYLLGYYKRISLAGSPPEEVKTPEQYEAMLKTLAENPVFQIMMAESPRACISNWEQIEKRVYEDAVIATAEQESFKKSHGLSAAYIVGLPDRQPGQGKYIFDDCRNAYDPTKLEQYRKRAARYLFRRLMLEASDFGEQLRYAIAVDRVVGFDELKYQIRAIIEKYLEQEELFENHFENTLVQIMNGELKEELKSVIRLNSKRFRELAELTPGRELKNKEDFNLFINANVAEINTFELDERPNQKQVADPEAEDFKKIDEKGFDKDFDIEEIKLNEVLYMGGIDEFDEQFDLEGRNEIGKLDDFFNPDEQKELKEEDNQKKPEEEKKPDEEKKPEERKPEAEKKAEEEKKPEEEEIEAKPLEKKGEEELLKKDPVIINNPLQIQDDPKKNLLDQPNPTVVPVAQPVPKKAEPGSIMQVLNQMKTLPVVDKKVQLNVINEPKPAVQTNVKPNVEPKPVVQNNAQAKPVVQPNVQPKPVVQTNVQPKPAIGTLMQPKLQKNSIQSILQSKAAPSKNSIQAILQKKNNGQPKKQAPKIVNQPIQPTQNPKPAVPAKNTVAKVRWESGNLPSVNVLRSTMTKNGYLPGQIDSMAHILNGMIQIYDSAVAHAIGNDVPVNKAYVYMDNVQKALMNEGTKYLNIVLGEAYNKAKPQTAIIKDVPDFETRLDLYMIQNNMNTVNDAYGMQDDLMYDDVFGTDIPLEAFDVTNHKLNSWEFPGERASKIPKKIMNCGNTNEIKKYIQEHGELNADDKKFLTQLASSNELIQKKIVENSGKLKKGEAPGPRLPVIKTANGGVEIVGTSQDAYQSSDKGCWSCSAALLLQGRGIFGLKQEDIRLFRSVGNLKEADELGVDATDAYNKDVDNRIIESGDLMTLLAQDSMVRETEVLKYRQGETPLNEKQYVQKSIAFLSGEIRKAIELDKSPVSLLRSGHYVTIVGIENRKGVPYVKVKDSIRHPGEKNPNAEVWKPLEDVVKNSLSAGKDTGINRMTGVSITWLADQKIEPKTGKLLNVPSNLTSVKKDGSLVTPPQEIQQYADMDKDERMKFGHTVLRQGGEEREERNSVSKDGLIIQERAYIPAKMNYNYIYEKSMKSPKALEAENARLLMKYMSMTDPKTGPQAHKVKMHNLLLVATDRALLDRKLPLNDTNRKNMLEALNKKEIVDQLSLIAKQQPGSAIMNAFEKGTLLKNVKGIKEIKLPAANNIMK